MFCGKKIRTPPTPDSCASFTFPPFDIFNGKSLQRFQVEMMNSWIKACSLLVNLEQRLEKGLRETFLWVSVPDRGNKISMELGNAENIWYSDQRIWCRHRSKLPELAALTGQSMFEVLPGGIWEQLSQLKSNIWNPGKFLVIGAGVVGICVGTIFYERAAFH